MIRKYPETMTSRERVIRTLQFEPTDRVTIGYESNPGIHARLCEALGIPAGDYEGLLRALGVDYRPIAPPYIGKPLHPVPENRMVDQLEGCIMRWVAHGSGGYWDFCDFPLQDAEDEDFDAFPIPNPDDFEYDAALNACRHYNGEFALYVGNAGVPDIINSNGRIMGMEDVLCHLMLENEAALSFIRRRADFQLKMMERTLEKMQGTHRFRLAGRGSGYPDRPHDLP